ncbi:MAG: carboxypeptidase-like regulatory domain-containing protein [Bacteroidales bacterium]|nr:carboxypeptidase-like regulatory domain-containing protein [Bacteroidales bacterium]MCF8391254.1 carboxypeptidase-like regulatory domain-containing protein [Bacteroidales bacterium]
MKKLFVLLFVVLSVSSLKAIEPGINAPAAVNSVQIEGKVTDVITGEALVGVSLKVKGSELTTYTDLNGNFKMEGVTPGTYDIVVDYVSYKNITLSKVSTSSSKMNLKVQLESVSLPL